MLTIGELAAHAGVTVRAVRHYHAKGLLPEPVRDQSGYRRYDAAAVIALIKIRTLTEAGVPLARVAELMRAGPAAFAEAIAQVDARLRAEIRERERHRRQIARLVAGDGLALPAEVVEYLDRLRALGVDERIVAVERDGWIPLAAQAPERIAEWLARKQIQLDAPEFLDFYLTLGRALDVTDDQGLVESADEMAGYLARIADTQGPAHVDDLDIAPGLAELLDAFAFAAAPPARRLVELLRERGWTGWTKVGRVDLPAHPA